MHYRLASQQKYSNNVQYTYTHNIGFIKMAYTPTIWENLPSITTPLNSDNLNKLEQGVKQIHDMAASGELNGDKGDRGEKGDTGAKGAKGDKGDKGDNGTAEITPESVDYGLSVKDGKLNLGRYDDEKQLVIIDTPAKGYDAFLIGRVSDEGRLLGFVKTKGYMRMVEGDAYVNISADNTDDLVGSSPKLDGKNRIGMNGYRVTLTAENEIILATSATGAFSAGIIIDKDNNSHAHNKTWDKDTLIVNNKRLMDVVATLEARIAALEAK